jgi:hypothetical membrane protein
MRQDVVTAPSGTSRIAGAESATRTRALLLCGVVAGPLFMALAAIQAFTREGFDLGRHPISLLTIGDLGWIQIGNFLVAGALVLAFAVGVRRALDRGPGRTWGPVLLGGLGLGLIAAGLFTPDASLGFPPGTPDVIPDDLSWHALAHGVGFTLAFVSLTVACLVFARRDVALGRPGPAAYSVATAVVALGLSMWPDRDGASIRYFVAALIAFAWTTALAARLHRSG